MARKEKQKAADEEVLHVEVKNYGDGTWWYPKSNECYRPDSPFRRLLNAAERDVFDTLTFLVFAGRCWEIRAAATFISLMCGGNPAPRTVEKYLAKFKQLGFIKLILRDRDEGNIYLVSTILMEDARAKTLRHYERAKHLTEGVRALEAPCRQPQERKVKRSRRTALSRDEQLAYYKQHPEIF